MDPRRRLQRLARRHRRLLAAALAGAGMLLALTALSAPPTGTAQPGLPPTGLRPGEVAVPVSLASPAVARTLSSGDLIDVVGLSGADTASPRASIVAPRTRVLEVPEASSTFSGSGSAVILLAVREADALALTVAMSEGPVSILIRSSDG